MVRRIRDSGLGLVFLAPSLAVFAVFFFYPFIRIVYWGTKQQNTSGTAIRHVGWSNYWDVWSSDDFLDGLWISFKYVLFTVPAGLVLGVLLAMAAHRKLKGIKVFQTIFSSTVATSVAVASMIFLVLLNPEAGKFKDVAWLDWLSLNDPDTALFGVSLSSVWQNLGLTFIIVLAGLQAVPDELMEAATVDGMSALRRFFTVTLPLLSPTLLFLVVVLTVFGFQAFAQVDILTGGEPLGQTETLVYKIFNKQSPADLGVASVMAVGLFGITFVVALLQFVLLERRVHYGR